jgi:F0F1-type ATP synthase membrane subunit c/vacuolar-type H+-ATPase subunit K
VSDPSHPATPGARVRPGVVTIASYLLFLVAAVQLIELIVSVSVLDTFNAVYDEAFAGTELADSGAAVSTATLIGSGVFGLVVAIGLVVLALLNNRGKNPARIVTWVVGGLFLCCRGAGLAVTGAGSAFTTGTGGGNAVDQAELQRLLDEQLPSWYTPVTVLLSAVSFVAILVALILLALPPANEFFRKPQPVWEPPMPGSTYPGDQGYPQSGPPPGYPQSGPPPGYPQSGPPPANPPGPESGGQWQPPSPPSGPPSS